MAGPVHSGSRAKNEPVATGNGRAAAVEQEWRAAEATDRREAQAAGKARFRRAVTLTAPPAVVAAAASTVLWWTPGFSPTNTGAAIIASAVAALLAVWIIPLTNRLARPLAGSAADDRLLFTAALASASAAAVHFSVIGMHFAEYTLYGVFFVVSAIAQLVWPIWLLLRRWRPLLVLGAIGNAAIVATWLIDRSGPMPIGPDATKPPPYGLGDSITSGFEVLLVSCCVAALLRGRRRPLRSGTNIALTLGTVALTTLAFLSVLGVAASVLPPSM
ncbi:MAG TPA: hypothetical protein VJ838_12345 [Gaiellaceae bacterium]|nr:hypothetical protein [Gaiellaceae bacterium]